MDFLYEGVSLIKEKGLEIRMVPPGAKRIPLEYIAECDKSLYILRQIVDVGEVKIVFDLFNFQRDKSIRPYPEETAYVIFLMIDGNIDAWHDDEYVKLQTGYWTFFLLKNMSHKANVPKGRHRFAHIYFPHEMVYACKENFPLFQSLLGSVEEDEGGIVNGRPLRISKFARCVVSHMYKWNSVQHEMGKVYFRALSKQVLLAFIIQVEIELATGLDSEGPDEKESLGLLKSVRQAFEYAPEAVTLESIAAMANVEAEIVDQHFLEKCYISATDLLNYFRMTTAFNLLIEVVSFSESTARNIGGKLGVSAEMLERKFEAFYNRTFEDVFRLKI